MEEKRYFFSSFPTWYLTAFLEQKEKKLLLLEAESLDINNKLLYAKISYLKTLTMLMKETLKERFLSENKTLTAYGRDLLQSTGVKREILKDIFTEKLIEGQNLIELSFLKTVIANLDIDYLQRIIDANKQDIYTMEAKKRFDVLLFQVDDEVKEELKEKIINDGKGY